MGFLSKLTALFSGKASGVERDGRAMYFYVKCSACGEAIRVRVDALNDLAQEYDENEKLSGYTLGKDIIGSKCFRMMHLHVTFDTGKRIIEQSLDHGTLISKEEFTEQLANG